ncbi:hypothetical protein BaRGS_00017164 [Batillaria attramentaria]|uniref:Glycosyltransferase family 92 protein n=1 Tax=Batillaria attramentaria TaxID=370345 RepID=A0ABD0KWH8_9CAEN
MRVRKVCLVKFLIYGFAAYGIFALVFVTYPTLDANSVSRGVRTFSVGKVLPISFSQYRIFATNEASGVQRRAATKSNNSSGIFLPHAHKTSIDNKDKNNKTLTQDKGGMKNNSNALLSKTRTTYPANVTSFPTTPVPSSEATTTTDFQQIQNNVSIYVYSAYYNDQKSPPVVTVIGVGLLKTLHRRISCRLLKTEYTNHGRAGGGGHVLNAPRADTVTTNGIVVRMPDSHNLPYGAIFIHCAISSRMPRPHQVSLVVNRRLPPLSCLRVTYPDPAPPRWQTALCLSPLHSNYSNWQQVIETMELVKILGADHVTAYVTSVSGNVRRVLQHYVTRTFMHVHMWRNPPQPVHYYGQIAAINDCLFRMRHASKLVVFTDLDEVIVPHVHGTWSAMLDSLRQRTNDSDHIAVFTFRNAFFYLSPPGPASNKTLIGHTDQVSTLLTAEQEEQARWLGLSSARRLYRTLYIWGDRDRSKMIVDPLRVAMVGIHYPHFLAKGYRAVIVHPNLALLHHYRQWSPQKTVRDISALRFAPRLIDSVKKTWWELGMK